MSQPTLVTPYGYSASTCGYCSPSGSRSTGNTSKKYACEYGFEGTQMSVKFYQDLIDRGWRRSGDFVYHPDMARTCCPQYTIRLDAKQFAPTKRHRQVINRWNRYLEIGTRDAGAEVNGEAGKGKANGTGKGKGKGKGKGQGGEEYNWMDELHKYESRPGGEAQGAVKFETELVPAVSTPETFELYKRYQIAIHKDAPSKITHMGFRRFLCDSPLIPSPIPYASSRPNTLSPLPETYGSYHLLHKINSKIIGISVIDILPHCVSSVYFIWDPDWAWASLGKLSALFEASLARRIAQAMEGDEQQIGEGMGKGGVKASEKEVGKAGWVYMGYWIANCQKMRYKSEYSPSFLLDPDTNKFHPLTPTLDRYLQNHPRGYSPFEEIARLPADSGPTGIAKIDQTDASRIQVNKSNESNESNDTTSGSDQDSELDSDSDIDDDISYPNPPPPGMSDPSTLSEKTIKSLLVLVRGTKGYLADVGSLEFRNPDGVKTMIREFAAALGVEMMARREGGMGGVRDKAILSF